MEYEFFMGLFTVFVPFVFLYVSAEIYVNPKIEKAKKNYLKNIARDIKKYAIGEALILKRFEQISRTGQIFICYFIVSVLIDFWLLFEDLSHMLGFVSVMMGLAAFLQVAVEDWDSKVHKQMETFRCPHCKAPFGYAKSGSYSENEQHYFRRETRHKNGVIWKDDVPMTSYTKVDVSRCVICKTEDKTRSFVTEREVDDVSESSAELSATVSKLFSPTPSRRGPRGF